MDTFSAVMYMLRLFNLLTVNDEVEGINNYAMFMGYQLMAMKGLGLLVFTWTTVILLGGFVSSLEQKDFWSLTVITLVQAAGVFDALVEDKRISYISKRVALVAVRGAFGEFTRFDNDSFILLFTALIIIAVQACVVLVILLPLAVLYMFGLYISTAISLWRLVQRDYINVQGVDNLKPALDVLYSLAVAQGVLFCYWNFLSFQAEGRLKVVANELKVDHYYVQKDLTSYALDLIINSDDYGLGIDVLAELVQEESGRSWVVERLLTSGSPSSTTQVIQKLLQPLQPGGSYRCSRLDTARLLVHVAGDMWLEQFPQAIECVASLLVGDSGCWTPEKVLELARKGSNCRICARVVELALQVQAWDCWTWAYARVVEPTLKLQDSRCSTCREVVEQTRRAWCSCTTVKVELPLQALEILEKLAAKESNCRVMANTDRLLAKIMAPVSSSTTLHRVTHDARRSRIVAASMQVMSRLAGCPGRAGRETRRQISANKYAILNMKRILECDSCAVDLHKQAMGLLTLLLMDVSFSRGSQSFANILVKRDYVIPLKKEERIVYFVSAAKILGQLSTRYTEDDEFLKDLMEKLTAAMPEVLKMFLSLQSEDIFLKRADYAKSLVFDPSNIYLEMLDNKENVEGVYSWSWTSERNLLPTLYSLRVAFLSNFLSLIQLVCNKFISKDQDLAHLFDQSIPGHGVAAGLPRMLKGYVEEACYNWDNTLDCLRMLKVISKMVIEMMEHRGSYPAEDMESLMNSLSEASETIRDFECIMAVNSDGDVAAGDTTEPTVTLSSLVEKARQLVNERMAQESEIMPAGSV
ncbi:hypothetical protein ACP4OV_022881 [Aristida adscensionis]